MKSLLVIMKSDFARDGRSLRRDDCRDERAWRSSVTNDNSNLDAMISSRPVLVRTVQFASARRRAARRYGSLNPLR
jgi:hypothetical protein